MHIIAAAHWDFIIQYQLLQVQLAGVGCIACYSVREHTVQHTDKHCLQFWRFTSSLLTDQPAVLLQTVQSVRPLSSPSHYNASAPVALAPMANSLLLYRLSTGFTSAGPASSFLVISDPAAAKHVLRASDNPKNPIYDKGLVAEVGGTAAVTDMLARVVSRVLQLHCIVCHLMLISNQQHATPQNFFIMSQQLYLHVCVPSQA